MFPLPNLNLASSKTTTQNPMMDSGTTFIFGSPYASTGSNDMSSRQAAQSNSSARQSDVAASVGTTDTTATNVWQLIAIGVIASVIGGIVIWQIKR